MNDPERPKQGQPIEILLVEDSPTDRLLAEEALREAKMANRVNVAVDGEQALQYLRRQGPHAKAVRPDLILLDLNLPKKDGREVLREIKEDPVLKVIPVVVLTTSRAEEDILKSYGLHANCYISKPVQFDEFKRIVLSIESFWFAVVKLPPRS
jgi:two-component system, chemotaxis family, response regulator Rcp1